MWILGGAIVSHDCPWRTRSTPEFGLPISVAEEAILELNRFNTARSVGIFKIRIGDDHWFLGNWQRAASKKGVRQVYFLTGISPAEPEFCIQY